MTFTRDQILNSAIGRIPSNVKMLELLSKPGKFVPAPIEQIKLDPHQIGTDDGLNKTEQRYLVWLRTLADTRIWVQCIGLRLAKKCFYYPDFGALDHNGLRFIDTKHSRDSGKTPFIEDDSLVKLKWAAQLYRPMPFFVAWVNEHGVWTHRQINPS